MVDYNGAWSRAFDADNTALNIEIVDAAAVLEDTNMDANGVMSRVLNETTNTIRLVIV